MQDIYVISTPTVVMLNGERCLLETGDRIVLHEAKQMAKWHRQMLSGKEFEKLRDLMVELIPDDDKITLGVLDSVIDAPDSVIEPDTWSIWSHFYDRGHVPIIKIKGKRYSPSELRKLYEKDYDDAIVTLQYPHGDATPPVSARSAVNRMDKYLKRRVDGRKLYNELAFIYASDAIADRLGVSSSKVSDSMESLQKIYVRARELYDEGPDVVQRFMSQHNEPIDAGDEPADYDEDDAFLSALESYAEALGYESISDIPEEEIENIRKQTEDEFDVSGQPYDEDELKQYQVRIGQVESEISDLMNRKNRLDPRKSAKEIDAVQRQIEKKEGLINTLQAQMSNIAVHGSPFDPEDVDDDPYDEELDNEYDREEIVNLLRHDPDIAPQFQQLKDSVI